MANSAPYVRSDCTFTLSSPFDGTIAHLIHSRGNAKDTKGTAFVVYEDIFDAKNAVDHLSGFNIGGRYLIVLYHQQARANKKLDQKKKKEEIDELKNKYGVE